LRVFKEKWRPKGRLLGAALCLSVLVIVLIPLVLAGRHFVGEYIGSCSSSKISASRDYGEYLKERHIIRSYTIETYDCDSGSTPRVSYTAVDQESFWVTVEASLECDPSSYVGLPGERVLDCEYGDFTFVTTLDSALIAQG